MEKPDNNNQNNVQQPVYAQPVNNTPKPPKVNMNDYITKKQAAAEVIRVLRPKITISIANACAAGLGLFLNFRTLPAAAVCMLILIANVFIMTKDKTRNKELTEKYGNEVGY